MTDFNHRSTDKRPTGDNIQKSILFGDHVFPVVSISGSFPNNSTTDSFIVEHGLGYVPPFDVYIGQRAESSTDDVLVNFPEDWFITTRFQSLFTYTTPISMNYGIYVLIDDQNLYVFWQGTNLQGTTENTEEIPIKYFIYQQGANV